jgi:HD-like signal output (HDOD) protein
VASQIGIDMNTAFTVGVVHSIGELIMHVGMPDEMSKMDQAVAPLAIKRAQTEFSTFGYTYADVGAALARDWRFPKSIVNAIEYQRAPFENEAYEPMAGVIHMAAWRARAAELKQTQEDLIHTYPDEIGELLLLDPDLLMDDFHDMLEA